MDRADGECEHGLCTLNAILGTQSRRRFNPYRKGPCKGGSLGLSLVPMKPVVLGIGNGGECS